MNFFAILIGCLFLYPTVSHSQTPSKRKTAAFDQYQQANSFKGIKFGSTLSQITSKMDLTFNSDLMSISYTINNSSYFTYNDFRFDAGQACFTRSGELFQVVLHIDKDPDALSKYLQLRKTFLQLFGSNDHERADIPTRLIEWEGPIISISFMFDPEEDNKTCRKGSVSLMVINNALNSKATDELMHHSNDRLPKM
jgi:hypothetical protein